MFIAWPYPTPGGPCDTTNIQQRTNDWSTATGYENDLTGPEGYISRLGRRIHFNRYTGVIMTAQDQQR